MRRRLWREMVQGNGSERPIGAVSCRQQHNRASCQPRWALVSSSMAITHCMHPIDCSQALVADAFVF